MFSSGSRAITIRFRLYPTHEQQEKMEQTLDGCRWVYNYFRKKQMSVEDMQFGLVELKESHPWPRNYHSKMLQYKAKIVIEVVPAYTSTECSRCHERMPKSFAVRTHVCPNCGLVLDRDYNSSIVVKQRGHALLCLPVERREVTPVEIPKESRKHEEAIRQAR